MGDGSAAPAGTIGVGVAIAGSKEQCNVSMTSNSYASNGTGKPDMGGP